MFIHPDARLNGFRAVKIPSNGELLRQFGFKEPSDKTGSNGSEFIEPDPENLDNLDLLERQRREINADAAVYQSQSHVSEPDEGKQGEGEPEPSATSE